MNGKSVNGAASGAPACIEGLPPLPKSLSGLLNSSGGSWREIERMHAKKAMIQDDLRRGAAPVDRALASKPANLDAALALLRKEMVRLVSLISVLLSACPHFLPFTFKPYRNTFPPSREKYRTYSFRFFFSKNWTSKKLDLSKYFDPLSQDSDDLSQMLSQDSDDLFQKVGVLSSEF